MRYVLDCSVAVRWFVPQTHSAVAVEVLRRFQRGETDLTAPDVIVPELGHVLRKLVLGRTITEQQAAAFLDRFLAIPIEMVPARELALQALDLALRHGATFYDALYLALAIRENCRVVTADERMTRAFATPDRTIPLASLA